ncbi:tautomerase family protein [Pararobbsia silviterrae]|uniref:4-oxalocrotonate tautomerase n=1 Tax=Pararobbsia silviterrae TaxID=1792498 RepID=A0A494YCM6_9BURK|nr:4-oxalocrotonate tautomerase [Pararobbsia silviterrae]RKP57754.1 4-oxalocrotonate tautomerase [Pararobbsia silviterrae]
MPGIRLTVSGREQPELTEKLATELTRLTCDVLAKLPSKMAVFIEYIPHAQWFIDNRSLAAHGKNAFQLELTITQHTNTREQKAEYHRKAFDLLASLIGNLHPHSNINVIDCDATGYGFGGLTREWKIHRGPSAAV